MSFAKGVLPEEMGDPPDRNPMRHSGSLVCTPIVINQRLMNRAEGRNDFHPPVNFTNSTTTKHRIESSLFAFVALLALSACATISTYDQEAYKNATSLKVDSLNIMSKATDSYSSHSGDIAKLQTALDKAYEYDRGRPLNEVTVKLWDKLRDPQRDLLGGFLREWKEDGPMKPKYVQHKKVQIGEAFDIVIQLESGKIKPAAAQKTL